MINEESLSWTQDVIIEWDHILDESPKLPSMWLRRERRPPPVPDAPPSGGVGKNPWIPLRHKDCESLSSVFAGGGEVAKNQTRAEIPIEGGRYAANLLSMTARHNYTTGIPCWELCTSGWFVRQKNAAERPVPLSSMDNDIVEALYHLGSTDEFSDLFGDRRATVLVRDGKRIIVVRPKALLNRLSVPEEVLQRGYGAYDDVAGEEEEDRVLGPTAHLVFVIHGIGESMWSREDNPVMGVRQTVEEVRIAVHRRQVAHWREKNGQRKKHGRLPLPAPGKIEFLPVEWHDTIHSDSSAMMETLSRVTPPSIPALRGVANDVIFDVLMYLTPAYCQEVLVAVTDQICDLHRGFIKCNPALAASPPKCSIVGHSLGSVMAWDLLSARQHAFSTGSFGSAVTGGGTFGLIDLTGADSQSEHHHSVRTDPWGAATTKKMEQVIPFEPHATILLGSPVGLFLTLRGAHAAFEKIRIQRDKEEGASMRELSDNRGNDGDYAMVPDPSPSSISPFVLPTGSLYNIYHPSDPVAYRIEPMLLDPTMPKKDVPQAAYVPAAGTAGGRDGLRMHVRAAEVTVNIARNIGAVGNLFNNINKRKGGSLFNKESWGETIRGGMWGKKAVPTHKRGLVGSGSDEPPCFPLGGASSRVDYQVQQGLVENQYMSSVLAHSGYFVNADVIDYISRIIGDEEEEGNK